MKKNNMLRIASVLLVAVLLSTCAISGAFAKYFDSYDAGNETARVAKFGITLDGTQLNTFAATYAADDTETGIQLTVDADVDVVAPGTTGTLNDCFTLVETKTGDVYDREVAVSVAYNAVVTLAGFGNYCPIVFNVAGEDYYIGASYTESDAEADNKITDTTELGTYVAAAIAANSGEFGVDERISGIPAVTWTWGFENGDTAFTQNDADDTALGLAGNASITIKLSATVTQID